MILAMKLFVLISHEFKHTVVLLYSYHSDVPGFLDLNVVLGVFSNSFLVISFTINAEILFLELKSDFAG